MKLVHRIDNDGYFVEHVEIKEGQEIPKDCVDCPFPQGLYRARYADGTFVSSVTEEEYETSLPSKKPSPIEELKQQQVLMQKAIDDLILGGF